MASRNNFPISIPFGGGGNKDMITATRDNNRSYLNLISKGRHPQEQVADMIIMEGASLDEDGNPDPGTVYFFEMATAGDIGTDGRGRQEHIMFGTGVIVPSWGVSGQQVPELPKEQKRHNFWERNGKVAQEDGVDVT